MGFICKSSVNLDNITSIRCQHNVADVAYSLFFDIWLLSHISQSADGKDQKNRVAPVPTNSHVVYRATIFPRLSKKVLR